MFPSIASLQEKAGSHNFHQFSSKSSLRQTAFIVSTYTMLSDGLSYNMFKGYRPAEVRLIFRSRQSLYHPDPRGVLYAFVHWYSKIPQRPNQFMKMYKVSQELDMYGLWKSGVVKLL